MRCRPFVVVALALVFTGCAENDPLPQRPSPVAGRIALTSFPSSVLTSGSQVRVTARVLDTAGSLVTGARVRFTTAVGSMEPAEVVTGSAGTAEAVLTADRATPVMATVDGVSERLDVGEQMPFTVRLGRSTGTVPVAGWRASVTVDPNRTVVLPPSPQQVTFICGGNSQTRSGFLGNWSPSCDFGSTGTYSVRVAAAAANGWEATDEISVIAGESMPPPLPTTASITATEVIRATTFAEWRFAAPAGFATYHWDFGGSGTGSRQTDQHVFFSEGPKLIRLTVTTFAGGTGSAEKTIEVEFHP